MSLPQILDKRPASGRWVMLTAYDATMARVIEDGGADLILVGDSLGTAVLGYRSENEVTLADMLHHAASVLRVVRDVPVVVDLPAGTYDTPEMALGSARLLMDIGAHMVKLEGCRPEIIQALRDAGIPIMAHLGYTPQIDSAEGSKVRGKNRAEAEALFDDAVALEASGAGALVLELVPREVAAGITERLSIPVIGIGSGPDVDGQVLVVTDMWGDRDANFKFLNQFGNVYGEKLAAVKAYTAAVLSMEYPGDEHSFHIKRSDRASWEEFLDTQS